MSIRTTAASETSCLSNSLPAKRGFKIASINVNSLTKHIDDLRIFLADNPVDVLAINESKLDDSIKNCELYIPGYEITRRDRNRNGGGVCFYIKTSINFVIELSIDNVSIKQVSTTKSLGILIDDNMAWHSHIDKLSKKIASGIGAIKRIKPFVSPEILHYIYNALVQPHFDYCSIVWGNCGKTLSEKLQKLQNRAARILTSSSYDADAGYLLQQLGWKDLIAQRQIQVALMVFKALNDLVPDYLSSMFTERSTPGYVLRDSTNKLNVPLPRTNYLKKSFSYRGATLWNSLPCSLRQVKSLNHFKQLLNDHFS